MTDIDFEWSCSTPSLTIPPTNTHQHINHVTQFVHQVCTLLTFVYVVGDKEKPVDDEARHTKSGETFLVEESKERTPEEGLAKEGIEDISENMARIGLQSAEE